MRWGLITANFTVITRSKIVSIGQLLINRKITFKMKKLSSGAYLVHDAAHKRLENVQIALTTSTSQSTW